MLCNVYNSPDTNNLELYAKHIQYRLWHKQNPAIQRLEDFALKINLECIEHGMTIDSKTIRLLDTIINDKLSNSIGVS